MWAHLQSVECSSSERAILLAHAALLDKGYQLKRPAHVDSQGVHMTILPSDWKVVAPKYSFVYERLDMQALILGEDINIHLSKPDGDVHSVTLREAESSSWAGRIESHLIEKLKDAPQAPAASEPTRDPVHSFPTRPQFSPDGFSNPGFGNLVGPNDPRWGPMIDRPMPGLRYDPIGPGGMDPDNDILMPPGFGFLPDFIG